MPSTEYDEEEVQDGQEERLQKVLAAAGVGSRRKCEELIAARRVRVNGNVAQLGDKVDATTAVELRTSVTVVGLDPAARRLTLDDGSTVDYDKLLIATGSTPRALPLPGTDLDGVLSLRTLADSDRISASLEEGKNVVIIGAGWIGLEIASAARPAGLVRR